MMKCCWGTERWFFYNLSEDRHWKITPILLRIKKTIIIFSNNPERNFNLWTLYSSQHSINMKHMESWVVVFIPYLSDLSNGVLSDFQVWQADNEARTNLTVITP